MPGGPVANRGANASLARRVIGSDAGGGRPYWAVPTQGGVCLVDGTGSGGCQALSDLLKDGTLGTDECPPAATPASMVVYGFGRDGVHSVSLVSDTGKRAVAVADNTWVATVPKLPDSARPNRVNWTTADGINHSLAIPTSPDIHTPC